MKSGHAGVNTLAGKIEALAVDVFFKGDALHVVLADGREVSAPLEWFPRLKRAASKQLSNWTLIGDGLVIHWPEIDEDIEVESLLMS